MGPGHLGGPWAGLHRRGALMLVDSQQLAAVQSALRLQTSPLLCCFPQNTLFSTVAFHSSIPPLREQPGADPGAGDSSLSNTD